jgi:hypothetical protein
MAGEVTHHTAAVTHEERPDEVNRELLDCLREWAG